MKLPELVSSIFTDSNHRISMVLILTNKTKTARSIYEVLPKKLSCKVMTSSTNVHDVLSNEKIPTQLVEESLSAMGLSVLNSLHDLILQVLGENQYNSGEKILAVLAEPVDGIVIFDTSSLNSNRLVMIAHEHQIEVEVLNRVMELARYIGFRGREGHPVGALFAIGSVPKLRRFSTQLVLNPFKGHSDNRRTVVNTSNHESLAEFAWLDGAIFFNARGVASDAGRYIQVPSGVSSKPGEGGRHLAARSISQLADCVSVCVSSTGIITLYSRGKQRYSVRLS